MINVSELSTAELKELLQEAYDELFERKIRDAIYKEITGSDE